MNEITDRTLHGPALTGAYLAADGSGSGAPRDGEDPPRNSLELGDMFEMGLESLLMYFRRKPGELDHHSNDPSAPLDK